MSERELDFVAAAAREQRVTSGDAIFHEGDAGDRFYILLEGEMEVERDGETIGLLAGGDFFGETALLFDTPRTATVRAVDEALVWSISRSAFQRVVGHYLISSQRVNPVVLERLRQSQAAAPGKRPGA